jgi:tetratricopeptide (TPR) repeat protein
MASVRKLRDDGGSHAERGLALQKQGDFANAITEYEAAVAANPELASAHVNLIALYGHEQNWAKAEAHYQAVLRAGTALAEAHYNYGVCLAAQGQHAAAADLFRKALDANPNYASAWSALARLAEMSGRLDEAETDYRKAAEQSPADPQIRFNIARMLIAKKQYKDAIAELEPVASVDHPDRPRILFALSTAYVLTGDVATGRQYAVEARDLARSRGQGDLAAAIERDLEKLPQ